MVLSFVHLVLNHSSTYMVFCLHGCFSKVSKNSVSRGPPVPTYSLFTWPNVDILLVTYPPHLIHVVIEWSLGANPWTTLSWFSCDRTFANLDFFYHIKHVTWCFWKLNQTLNLESETNYKHIWTFAVHTLKPKVKQ